MQSKHNPVDIFTQKNLADFLGCDEKDITNVTSDGFCLRITFVNGEMAKKAHGPLKQAYERETKNKDQTYFELCYGRRPQTDMVCFATMKKYLEGKLLDKLPKQNTQTMTTTSTVATENKKQREISREVIISSSETFVDDEESEEDIVTEKPRKTSFVKRYNFPDGNSYFLMKENPYPQKPIVILCSTHPAQPKILAVERYQPYRDGGSFKVDFAKNEMGYHRLEYDIEKEKYSLTQGNEDQEIILRRNTPIDETLQFNFWLAIEERKTELRNEINRWWFTCNHDRKRGKIADLSALQDVILDSTEQNLLTNITEFRSAHSQLNQGFFSRRTKKLLNNFEVQCEMTYKKT